MDFIKRVAMLICCISVSNELFADSFKQSSIVVGEGHLLDHTAAGSLIGVSTDKGKSWDFAPSVFKENHINAGSVSACFYNEPNSICVIPGLYNSSEANFPPDLIISQDGGKSWHQGTILGLPTYQNLYLDNVSCIRGNGTNINCLLTGFYFVPGDENSHNFIAFSRDNAASWIVQPITELSNPNFVLNEGQCTGKDRQAVCAIGAYSSDSAHTIKSFIVTSQDGGETWHTVPVDTPYSISHVYCTGNSKNAICVGIAAKEIIVSQDGGNSWVIKHFSFPPNASHLTLWGGSCTGENKNAICTLIGSYLIHDPNKDIWVGMPLIIVSRDGGNSWERKSISIPSENITLDTVSCTGEGVNAFCAAAGDGDVKTPVLLTSTNGGETWSEQKIPGFVNGRINRIICKGTPGDLLCTAEGFETRSTNLKGSYTIPLVAVSDTQGNHWVKKSIKGMPFPIQGAMAR